MGGTDKDPDKEALIKLGTDRLKRKRAARECLKWASQHKLSHASPLQKSEYDLSVLLIVEVEQSRDLLTRLLSSLGFKVVESDDLRSALTQLHQLIPEFVVIEMKDGAESSLQILQTLRSLEKIKDLPALVVLAPKDTSKDNLFYQDKQAATIARPFSQIQITDSIDELLARSISE